jgi:hypothetical protein
MKRLSLLTAAAALLIAGSASAAHAQAVLSGSGASVTVATPLAGTVLVEDTGVRRLPSGYNETGRLARFMGDSRLMRDDIQFSNRDFQQWYPLEARTKSKMDRRVAGSPRSQNHPIADYEVGRLHRYISDSRLQFNDVIFNDRDFYGHQPIYAPSSKSLIDRRVRGLATGTNVINTRRVAVRLMDLNAPAVWY